MASLIDIVGMPTLTMSLSQQSRESQLNGEFLELLPAAHYPLMMSQPAIVCNCANNNMQYAIARAMNLR